MTTIGILHPGQMGAALAAQIRGDVIWASEGRSDSTRSRAETAGLIDVVELASLTAQSEIIISICPPHVALDLAREVAGLGFRGLYVDANAVSPATVGEIAGFFESFVDGGIVGGPPTSTSGPRLYLSGDGAGQIEGLFHSSTVTPKVLGVRPGQASAMKAAFAGWTKGSAALLAAMAAYAQSHGLLQDLLEEWKQSIPGLEEKLTSTAPGLAGKAWRFEGEMDEIASALGAVGIPEGFHEAASEIYRRVARGAGAGTVDDLLGWILESSD